MRTLCERDQWKAIGLIGAYNVPERDDATNRCKKIIYG